MLKCCVLPRALYKCKLLLNYYAKYGFAAEFPIETMKTNKQTNLPSMCRVCFIALGSLAMTINVINIAIKEAKKSQNCSVL